MNIYSFACSITTISFSNLYYSNYTITHSQGTTNCFSVFIPKISVTSDSVPTKICATLHPLSIAGVSAKTGTVVMGSLRHGNFQAGYGDEYAF